MLVIVNTFALHTLLRKITHSAVMVPKTTKKFENLKCGGK